MGLPQTGGCRCGKVRYAITQEPQSVYTCHCTACQRLTVYPVLQGPMEK